MTIKGSWLHPHESNTLSDIDFAALPFKAASSCPFGPFLRLDRFLEVSLWPAKLVQLQCVLDLHRCDQMVSFQLGFYVDEEDRNTGSRTSTEWWLHWCVKIEILSLHCEHKLSSTRIDTLKHFTWDGSGFCKEYTALHTLKDVTSVQMIQGATKRRRRWKKIVRCGAVFFFLLKFEEWNKLNLFFKPTRVWHYYSKRLQGRYALHGVIFNKYLSIFYFIAHLNPKCFTGSLNTDITRSHNVYMK